MGNAFQFEELDGSIGLVTFDTPDKKVNTFAEPILAEFRDLVGQLEGRTDLQGLLFRSGKPGQFIAGADLNELGSLIDATPAQVEKGISAGHELFTRVSRLPFPVVALVDGNCMGGGTELILAMDYRIASENPKTRIALPEVTIGIIPGWGGTQRMPRIVGIHHGITMICTGEGAKSEKARAIGLVFDSVPVERLIEDGCRLIRSVRESGDWIRQRKRMEQPLGMTEDQMQFAFAVAEGGIAAKSRKDHYPAPFAALRAIREGINLPLDEGLAVERRIACEVTGTPISANLIGVFFKNNTIGRSPGVDSVFNPPRTVNRVGVLGAGLMGAGIATAHARRGLPTVMVDLDNDRVNDGLKRAAHVVESRIRIGRATPEDLAHMLALLSTATSQVVFSDCDVVIEAVTENEELKKTIYGQLARAMRDDAILATNTSTISITRMAESSPSPERFVGMHFFSPVDRMQLVEVIRGEKTTEETVSTVVKLAKNIGKTPIVVNDCPGFLVNRILMPYMSEAVLMLTEGADMDAIDKAATRFGMPVGPIALHDMVGNDTAFYAGKVLTAAYADRAVEIPLLGRLVEAGRLGKKTGTGFRKFSGKKGLPSPDPDFAPILAEFQSSSRAFSNDEITDRLFLTMLLEAVRALDEQIVAEAAHVDMGMILGCGFPPFRGGVLGWCDTEGAASLVSRAEQYSSLGPRFAVPETLKQMAENDQRFYPRQKPATFFGGKL